jgi:hypothetical protein
MSPDLEDSLRVISRVEAQRLSSVSPDTWLRLEKSGRTPPLTRLSDRRVGYRLVDLRHWLDARRESAS